jgi:NAD(P)-dependent dehydrogenase (short-subunit alcohol dehydrogenase family)
VTEHIASDFGAYELLVNDAGVGVAATLLETSTEDWDRTIAINLTAMFHTCRAVLPAMLDAGTGLIVNVSSIAGVVGLKNRLAYCASKHGVIGLTRAIAADYAHLGIRCNAICPGTVASEWIAKILADAPDPEATRKQMEQRQLDGRMGTPEEVAAGIAFIASEDGRFINGAAFMMDGGVTAV